LRQLRRFCHPINADKVFGTHKRKKGKQRRNRDLGADAETEPDQQQKSAALSSADVYPKTAAINF